MVTLDQLRYFITASEEGGFAAAGKKLFVTTQTISGAIHALEGYVGGKLFEKRAGHMVPTQEGAMLMTQAKYVLRECEAFDAHAKALFINKSNHPLRIVIADYYPSGVALDADIAHALLSEFTCTNLEMWNCRATACLDALRMGRADASILLGCPEETDMESESILKMHPHIAFSENNATGDSILDGISSGKTSVATPLDPAHFANKYADQIGIPSRLISFETVRPATNELRRFFSQGGSMFVLPNAQIMSLIDDITLKKLDSTFAMTGSLVWPRAYEHPLLPRFKASLLEKLVSRQFMHKPTLAN